MKLTKYYSPETQGSGDLGQGKDASNFAALSSEFLNKEYLEKDKKTETTVVPEEKIEPETPESFGIEGKEELEKKAESLGLPKTATEEEVKTAEIAAAEKAKTGTVDLKKTDETPSFEIPEGTEGGTTNTDEDSWKALALKHGVEIQDDSYDAYFKGVQDHYEKQAQEKLKITYEDIKKNLAPEAQMTLDLLNSGLTIEEITKPTQEIEQFKKLSDAELVRKDLELQEGWTTEMVDKEMERLAEGDLVEHEAKKIRVFLDSQEKKILNDYQQRVKEYQEKTQNRVNEVLQQEATVISEHLNKVGDFMETPLNDKVRNYLMNNYKAGKYDQAMKNPEKIIKFMLFEEFGEKAAKNLSNKYFEKGRSEYGKNLHNVPPLQQGSLTKNQSRSTGNSIGNFAILEGEFGGK